MLGRRDLLQQLTGAAAASTLLAAVAGAAVPAAGGAARVFAARSGRLGDPGRGQVLVGGLVVPVAEVPALERELAAIGAALGRGRRLRFATNPRNTAHFRRALAVLLAHPEVRYAGAWIEHGAPPQDAADHAARRAAAERTAWAGALAGPLEIEALRHDFAVDDAVCRSLAAGLGCRVTLLASAELGSPLMDLAGALTKALNAGGRTGGNAVKAGMATASWAAFGLVPGGPRTISATRLGLRQLQV
jgi:hypothetical protein